MRAARERGIDVCGTGYFSSPTAEHTWALILAVCRNLPAEAESMRRGGWQRSIGRGLHGRTLGLLGLGRLGSAVAGIGQAFGMTTIAWSQNLTPERAAEHGVQAVSKQDLFARADVLSVHVVLSARTRGLVGAAELAAMKPDAVLVNTSRGPIVEEQALVEALRRGAIAAAALDVFDVEPLPADHPLRDVAERRADAAPGVRDPRALRGLLPGRGRGRARLPARCAGPAAELSGQPAPSRIWTECIAEPADRWMIRAL